MRGSRPRIGVRLLGAILAGLALACNGGGGGSAGGAGAGSTPPSYTGNYHPKGWLDIHPGQAIQSIATCTQCHEISSLRVGSAIPSCMTAACHHDPVPGWSVPGSHGLQAKAQQGAGGGGLVSCQLCHGANFGGGYSGNSCVSCHGVKAPHPHKPWRAPGLTHASTDPSNAAVCVQCHYPGSPNNPAGHPATPAPNGTAPGCFNNTGCHGDAGAPHALGSIWKDATSPAFHGLEAKKDLSYCQSCHGTPGTTHFDGGAASTKCSTCHTVAKAHSDPWHAAPAASFPGYVPSHRNALKQSTTCTICHDVVKGRTPPEPIAPSCFSSSFNGTGCHANGPGQASHPIPFIDQGHFGVNAAGFDGNCAACHAVAGTSPSTAAPSCAACHQAGSPLSASNCTSCHAKPPAGTVFPNTAGKHAKHDALAGVTGQCTACHSAADSMTQVHYDHANGRPGSDFLRTPPGVTAFLSTFTGKGGAASFDPSGQTCSNTSCHGGVKTPSWQNGSIDTTTDSGCRQCHTLGTAQGVPENNSPFSGTHARHLDPKVGALCTDCHAMGNGSTGANNHFKFLSTPQMEGPASDTVAPMGSRAYYQPGGQTCGTFTCHGMLHTNFTWTGGPNHAVPFLAPAHTLAKQPDFDTNCVACHGLTGSSANPLAPLCTTCHQAGSPFALPNCASCHGKPPVGSAFPDVAGKHAQHSGMTGGVGECSACHTGSDSDTQAHYDHANAVPGKNSLRVPPGEVGAAAVFGSKAGAMAFDNLGQTCSNTSCHGGIKTPAWASGSIDVNAEAGCRQCHALGSALGTPENNSLFSGAHALHLGLGVNALCTDCHAMNNGSTGAANHFKFTDTPKMEGPASDTIQPLGNRAWYQPQGQTCGTFTCHGTAHGSIPWNGGPNHAVPFQGASHTAVNSLAAFTASCATCHADGGSTSPLALAPTCQACHTVGSPLTVNNCASCHGRPPSGAAFPNLAAKHAKHDALAGITGNCAACHSGADTGSQSHYDHANALPGKNALRVPPAPVALLPGFNANAGAASFTASSQTCSNTSCHGGLPAPAWASGSIATNTDAGCVQCHQLGTAQGAPENNSHFSGLHAFHLDTKVGAACSDCHSMTNGTAGAGNHFKFLGTPGMEGPASDTVMPMGVAAYYQPGGQTCGTFTCHGTLHANHSWKGGPSHAVPFTGSGHYGVTSASFATSCASCHGDGGSSSPMATAPTCQTCHTGGSPLTVNNCASCHGRPPAGAAFPNLAAKHAKHDALAGVTGNCATCHSGADTGSQSHYDHANARPGMNCLRVPPAPVATLALFNAKAGAAAFTASSQTCSNTSCHGGVTTPAWSIGSIATNTDAGCVLCHQLGTAQGVPENNSHYSGLHALHLATKVGAVCSDCHSMANGTPGANNHFKSLSTPAMEGPASDTVTPMGVAAYYQPGGQTCGTFTCHGQAHGSYPWKGGASHAVPFLGASHTSVNTAAAFAANCATCHADGGSSSPLATVPTCQTCHTGGSPLTVNNCASCHGKPPAGAAFPNLAAKHGKHDALAGVTGNCATCHSGADTGSQSHYDHANARPGMNGLRVPPAPVATLALFNAKAGAAAFTASSQTCSNTSCHGGVSTPGWASGTILTNTDAGCAQCHKLGSALGVPESNSHYSGLHALHLAAGVAAVCSDCHAMANGTTGANNHFRFLSTLAMEGPASDTVAPMGVAAYYQPGGQTCGTFTCHGQLHGNFSWKGGAPHAVPFRDAGHLTVTPVQFTASCATCHVYSGTSPLASAPTCNVCHQLADPTSLGKGVGTCLSCHVGASGLPAGPTGSTFPSVAGAHPKHFGLLTAVNCNSCHLGVGAGTPVHYDSANYRTGTPAPPVAVAFGATFQSQSGGPATATAVADPTCSNISCHGGKPTPAWQSGKYTVNGASYCLNCHKIASTATQYNDAIGRHNNPNDHNQACDYCHDMTVARPGAQNHFKYLDTPAVSGVSGTPPDQYPSDTIVFGSSVTGAKTYTVTGTGNSQGRGGCALSCHGEGHSTSGNHWN